MTIVAADMRHWQAPEKADILVSELLGSFGDNELSPECLDGAQRFLSQDGISIPAAYTSFIQPVTTFKLWNDVKVRCWALQLLMPFPAPKSKLLNANGPVQIVFQHQILREPSTFPMPTVSCQGQGCDIHWLCAGVR